MEISSDAKVYKIAVILAGKYLDIREKKLVKLKEIIECFGIEDWELRKIHEEVENG